MNYHKILQKMIKIFIYLSNKRNDLTLKNKSINNIASNQKTLILPGLGEY